MGTRVLDWISLITLSLSLTGNFEDGCYSDVQLIPQKCKAPGVLTSYFLAFLPKINCAQTLGEFRSISLLGSLYKVIAKVLVARLGNVMESLISNQHS